MNNTNLNLKPSPYKGSPVTAQIVKQAVLEKYGEEVANEWTPNLTRSFRNWVSNGFRIKQGEKAIRSFTMVMGKDKDGSTDHMYKKPVFLFHVNQVEPINS